MPQELKVKDLTLEGGKKGYEVLERFLNNVSKYLKRDGKILIVFSSLTNKRKVDDLIRKNIIYKKYGPWQVYEITAEKIMIEKHFEKFLKKKIIEKKKWWIYFKLTFNHAYFTNLFIHLMVSNLFKYFFF